MQLTRRNRRGAADGKEQTRMHLVGGDTRGSDYGKGQTWCTKWDGTYIVQVTGRNRRGGPRGRDTLCNVQVTGRNRRGAANSKEQTWYS